MRDVKKILENTKETIKDNIKPLIKKGDLTPAEMATLRDAIKTIKDICEMCREDPDGNEYSMGNYGYSVPHWTNDPYAMGNYSGQNRSPVTGRYISNGAMRVSYGDNYSGHSIKDRMVARLEPMFDEAKSDYERQLIQNTINRIHAEN